ncbi:hypothetical protein [Parasitella parasitica]|uniref:Swiss Army Knife RNA repair protein HAD domain-containing protein n=1 Tax=Parasitella parasitica TaxID=35722 RepID=A0A0B7N9I7_9FUNG|nr:hypothetical protein [Parasitella parasitica]
MRMYINESSDLERGVLSRQLRNSPKQLPVAFPNIWHTSFVNAITTENLFGPGWCSLRVHLDKDDLWCRYWNEDVVAQVKESMVDPSHLTALLTGRRYHPFHELIDNILASKELEFDIVGLRPDPESSEPKTLNALMFNHEPNVFETNMHFNTSFIVNILDNIPSITSIIMWDDRQSHVCVFKEYLAGMKEKILIKDGKIICVVTARPKYNPEWELQTVKAMLDTHNSAIHALRHTGKPFPEANAVIENYGQIISPANTFTLKKIDWIIALKLSPDAITYLQSVFKPLHYKDLSTAKPQATTTWKANNAEGPVFFGNQVLLAMNTKANEIRLNKYDGIEIGKEYKFRVVARSISSIIDEAALVQAVQLQ